MRSFSLFDPSARSWQAQKLYNFVNQNKNSNTQGGASDYWAWQGSCSWLKRPFRRRVDNLEIKCRVKNKLYMGSVEKKTHEMPQTHKSNLIKKRKPSGRAKKAAKATNAGGHSGRTFPKGQRRRRGSWRKGSPLAAKGNRKKNQSPGLVFFFSSFTAITFHFQFRFVFFLFACDP